MEQRTQWARFALRVVAPSKPFDQKDLELALEAIKLRHKAVHEGWRPRRDDGEMVRAVLRIVGATCEGPRLLPALLLLARAPLPYRPRRALKNFAARRTWLRPACARSQSSLSREKSIAAPDASPGSLGLGLPTR